MNDFIEHHFVNYSNIKSNSDLIPTFYAYIFDLYFPFSLNLLKKEKYLDKFTNRVYDNFTNSIVKQQTNQLLEISNKFINNN